MIGEIPAEAPAHKRSGRLARDESVLLQLATHVGFDFDASFHNGFARIRLRVDFGDPLVEEDIEQPHHEGSTGFPGRGFVGDEACVLILGNVEGHHRLFDLAF